MKKIYYGYSAIFFITIVIELIQYLKFNSTLYGLIYMILNFVVMFFIFLTGHNYSKKNTNLRISKNIFNIFIILFTVLILNKFDYNDESEIFINNMETFIKIIKPALSLILLAISILDFKLNYKRNYKIN